MRLPAPAADELPHALVVDDQAHGVALRREQVRQRGGEEPSRTRACSLRLRSRYPIDALASIAICAARFVVSRYCFV